MPKCFIVRTVLSKRLPAKKIRCHIKTTESVCIIRKSIIWLEIIKYVKPPRCLSLTSGNRKSRIQFTEKYLKQHTYRSKIIFNNEKKLIFDGLVSIHSY